MHPEIGIIRDGHVALLEMRRPPHNFMDVDFIAGLADALNELDARHTLRRGLADRIQAATEREAHEQRWQRTTADHQEGIAAMNERRPPVFNGR